MRGSGLGVGAGLQQQQQQQQQRLMGKMVKTFQAYLPECCHRTYSCVHCRAHLANHDELISKVLQHCNTEPTYGLENKTKNLLSSTTVNNNNHSLLLQSFQGSQGRAYLFNSVVNVGCGPAEERVLLTGLHAVADIYCESCKTTLGWKYVRSYLLICFFLYYWFNEKYFSY